MNRVQRYAAPTPVMSTPSIHACFVSNGSVPMVMWNTYAAATEVVNCAASIQVTGDFMPGAYHG